VRNVNVGDERSPQQPSQQARRHQDVVARLDEHQETFDTFREQVEERFDNLEAALDKLPQLIHDESREVIVSGELLDHDSHLDGKTWRQYLQGMEEDHRRYDTYDDMLHNIVDILQGPEHRDVMGVLDGRDEGEGLMSVVKENKAGIKHLQRSLDDRPLPGLSPTDRIAIWLTALTVVGGILAAIVTGVLSG
jgi:hypothetical protein